ncbi:MAG: hypothetical protein PHE17_20915 [Thiothrix sp.]|uniref:hypothetical protein n=1 Tax=Thiothrix sp. TaxID=1032 RepID=UPI0026199B90|nr:hypothetical protein [Thiothrix sp.]MDD5395493.1 hypothetical protein [Thiothrix sp.]
MDNFKEKAIAISNKFPFNQFQSVAAATNGAGAEDAKISSCDNHLDAAFMALLDKGAHLDSSRMPL